MGKFKYRVFLVNKPGHQDVENMTLVDTIKKFFGYSEHLELENLGGDVVVLERFDTSVLYLGKIIIRG